MLRCINTNSVYVFDIMLQIVFTAARFQNIECQPPQVQKKFRIMDEKHSL